MSYDESRVSEQYVSELETALSAQGEARLRDLHTCLPAIVTSVDLGRQTLEAQPAIKRVFTERGAVNLPLCVDVPICFPGGGDFWLTFPVKAGDECLLMFSERAIDYWYINGDVQLPAEYRLHDLSDAFALVGVTSQPRRLSNVQSDGAELRTGDRSTFIRLTRGIIRIKGNIVLEGDINQTGQITSSGDHKAGSISLQQHRHTGVQSGTSNTGVPVP